MPVPPYPICQNTQTDRVVIHILCIPVNWHLKSVSPHLKQKQQDISSFHTYVNPSIALKEPNTKLAKSTTKASCLSLGHLI
jgi:hypothetical protein